MTCIHKLTWAVLLRGRCSNTHWQQNSGWFFNIWILYIFINSLRSLWTCQVFLSVGDPREESIGKWAPDSGFPLPMTQPPGKQKSMRNLGDGEVWGQGGGNKSLSRRPQLKTFADVLWIRSEADVGLGAVFGPPQYLRTTSEVIQSRQAQVCGCGSHSWDTVSNLFTVYLP